jgi:hypothetical protein
MPSASWGSLGLRKALGVYGGFGVYGIVSVPLWSAEHEPLVTYLSMSPRKRIRRDNSNMGNNSN